MSDCHNLCGSTVALSAALWVASYVIAGIIFELPQLNSQSPADLRVHDLLFGAMSVGALCFASMVLSLLGLYPREVLSTHLIGLQLTRATIIGVCLLPIVLLGGDKSLLHWVVRLFDVQQMKTVRGVAYRFYIGSLLIGLAIAISMAADVIYLFTDTPIDTAAAVTQKPLILAWYVGVLLILASSYATAGLVGIAATFLRRLDTSGTQNALGPIGLITAKFAGILAVLLGLLALLYFVPTLFSGIPYLYWQLLDWFSFLIGILAIRLAWPFASLQTREGQFAIGAIVLMIVTIAIDNPMLKFELGPALWNLMDRISSIVLAIMAVFWTLVARTVRRDG